MKYPYSSYNTPLPGYGTSLVDRINLYLHFRRYFKMIAERWLLLVIFTTVGTGIGVWVALTTPFKYESYSVLMIAPRIRATGIMGDMGDDPAKFSDTQIQLMNSGQVLNKVYTKIQEGANNSNKMVRPKIDAFAGKGNTFILKVSTTNFDYAQKFATAWAQEFIEFKKQQKASSMSSAEASMQRDMLLYEQRLERARQSLDDFRKKNNIANINDAGQAAAARLDRAKAIYQELVTELKLYENANAEQLAVNGVGSRPNANAGSGASSNPGTADRNGRNLPVDSIGEISDMQKLNAGQTYSDIKRSIRRIEADITDRLKTLKEQHPYIVMSRKNIENLKVELKSSLEIIEEMRLANIDALKTRMESYPPLIQDLTEEVFQSTSIQNEYQRLLEDERIIKDNLDMLRRQLASIGAQGADDEQFQPVEIGGGSPEPTGPNRPYIIGAGILMGLLAGIGAMYLLHRLDDRLEQPEDIEEQLEEPIMGQLPEVDKKHYKEGYLLLTRMKQHTMFAESLRGVRSALLLSPEGASKRLLAVTSAVPGDGKTTFTANFAVTLANAGNKTLLIDADLRRGNIHGYFEQPLEGGMSEVLQGKMPMKEAVRETGIPNLYFMRAGERPSNPSELLIGPTTKDFVRDLRAEFDYVIFDCPPLTAIDDTFSIAAYLDGLFFVVRAGKTSIRFAKLGINTIRQRGAPILGLIVNGVPIDNPYYYYTTYYYASYYHRPLAPDEPLYLERKRKALEAGGAAPKEGRAKPAESVARAVDIAPTEVKPTEGPGRPGNPKA